MTATSRGANLQVCRCHRASSCASRRAICPLPRVNSSSGIWNKYGFHVEGKMPNAPKKKKISRKDASGRTLLHHSGFLETIRIPLLRAATFLGPTLRCAASPSHRRNTRRLVPGEDPIRQALQSRRRGSSWWPVVGVTVDVHHAARRPIPSIQCTSRSHSGHSHA